MKKSTVILCLMYSLSFSSCDDPDESYPQDIIIESSCRDAVYFGEIPETECISDMVGIATVAISDFDETRCVVTIDYVTCFYCNADGYACSGE